METDYACNSNGGTLQVGDAACNPIRPHADGREAVNTCFGAQVVDLGLSGIEFEEGVVDGGGDGGRERVGGFIGVVGDGRDG